MLYFNYVANIIKFGICWDDGHVGICGGYVGMRGGICGDMCYMRDGPPPRNHPGRAAVFGAAPPIQEGRQMGTENDQRSKKKNAYFFI